MDVLQEIARSNGRSINLLQHARTDVSIERGKYVLRGYNANPAEIVTVYLTDDELDRLIEERTRRGRAELCRHHPPRGSALHGLMRLAEKLKP
jgi:hypothetical protein